MELKHRFGFNGEEKDPGFQNNYDPGLRIYNVGVLSIDSLADDFPWGSPYAFAENRVIYSIDLEGGENQAWS